MSVPISVFLPPLITSSITGTLGIVGTVLAARWRERKRLRQTGELSTVKQLRAQIQQERNDCVATQTYLRAQIATWQGDARVAWESVDRLLSAANKLDPVNAVEILLGQRLQRTGTPNAFPPENETG